jgi:ribosome maturation factor RimP
VLGGAAADGLLPAEPTALGDGDDVDEPAGSDVREACWSLLHDTSPASRTVKTSADATLAARTVAAEAMPEAINATTHHGAPSRQVTLGLCDHNSTAGGCPVSTDQTRDRLAGVLTDPLAASGLDLEAIDLAAAGKRRLLRVAVDKDGGVTLDDIAEATKQVGVLLDRTDVMGEQPYTLEVTSPGTDRPLTLPRHWRRNQGRLVKVKLGDEETVTGRIVDSDESGARLDVDGTVREVPFDEVSRAKVQIEFSRPDESARVPSSTSHQPKES